jgi:hypothetical protein
MKNTAAKYSAKQHGEALVENTRRNLVGWGLDPDSKTPYSPYSLLDLHVAFDLVKDRQHWKNPISKVVALPADVRAADLLVSQIEDAVIFFAGCTAEVVTVARRENGLPKRVRVEAIGYYMAVGA